MHIYNILCGFYIFCDKDIKDINNTEFCVNNKEI